MRKKTKVLGPLLKKLYIDEMKSVSEIAAITGLPRGSVYYRLLQFGIKPRDRRKWWQEMRDRARASDQ